MGYANHYSVLLICHSLEGKALTTFDHVQVRFDGLWFH
jgi:hypothetical protein